MQRKNNRLQSDLLLWIGVLLCSIPLLTGWYSQKKTQNVLATYEQVVEQTTGDEIEQLRNQADKYNKKLWAESKGVREQSEPDQMEEYEGLLNAKKYRQE